MAEKTTSESKTAPTKKRNGGRKPILAVEGVALALVKSQGNLSAVARKYSVHRSSVQNFIAKHPALVELLGDCREGRLDDAEDSLGKAVRKGEGWAVCFTLKTLGKSRGYVERQEITGASDAPPVRVKYVKVEVIDAPCRIGDGTGGGGDTQAAPGSGEGA